MRRLLIFAAPAVLLAACASAPDPDRTSAAEAPDAGQSAYGMYLAGEAALNDGRSADAARFFARAGAEDPSGAALIRERAFMAALLSGEVAKAAALAPAGESANEAARRLGELVQAVEDLSTGKAKEAHQLLTSGEISFPHRAAAALLAPWAAAAAGDLEGSLVRPQVRGDKAVDYFGELGQALLYERANRYGEAETDFKLIVDGDDPSEVAVLAYGGFLERRGRRADAVEVYKAALARDPGRASLTAALARAEARKAAPPPPTVREGAAQALLAAAASMIQAKQTQIGLAYLRLTLRLDPNRDDAWVMAGDLMQGAGDVEAARAAFAHPRPGSADYAVAQAKLAWTYQQAGDKETALKLARGAAASGDDGAERTLADLLLADERYAEAADLLTKLIGTDARPDWRLLYARGQAEDRLGRWTEAQADLRAALQQQPDDPELLNYLGYSWIDRGENLQEAKAMVEKAVAANPRSGAMLDSLGWAYYKLGDYKQAVQKLEDAVELEAGDPDINNHLGDAYWKVGRRDEAMFQWRRVLTLKPDEKMRAAVEAKLAAGGPVEPPQKIAGT